MTVTGIARLAVFEALCEASTQEVLRFSPDDPAVTCMAIAETGIARRSISSEH